MAGVQGSGLALAVCRASGVGSLPCAMLGLDALHSELQTLQANLPAGRAYNVNFFCHQQTEPDAAREAAWRGLFAKHYAQHGLDAHNLPAGASRLPFGASQLEVLKAFQPPVVSFHFGLPAPELLSPIRAWGGQIWSSATTVAEARWLLQHGVDAVIAQGLEAGGHRGVFLESSPSGNYTEQLHTQLGTFALLPQVVRAAAEFGKPVIAAGGIVDAAGVRAAQALGAAAVQVGTAFLCAHEASTSTLHRAALRAAETDEADVQTALTTVFTGRPARGLINGLMRELGALNPAAPAFPLATAAHAPLRALAEKAGSTAFTPLWSGQHVRCKTAPAAEIVAELMQGWG